MIRRFADFELDLERFELRRRDGERIHVEPQVFDVLAYLTCHAERVVTKEELLDEVWGTRFVTESTLTSRVKAARRAIGDHGSTQALIRTVRGRGFRFAVPVETVASAATLTAAFAAQPPGEPPPATTLSDGGPLIGRDCEAAELSRMLLEARLVSVVGPGGVGKTRLAMHVVERVSRASSCSTVFVDLAPVTQVDAVVRALTQSVGIQFGATDDPLAAVVHAVGDSPCLMLIDNFEQVADAAPLVADLLDRAPALRVLVTSRERLRLRDEQVFTLDPLGCDADGATRAPAVELFELAARRISADFAIDDGTLADVEKICRDVEGLPLAIELVAAYIPVLSPGELLSRLDSILLVGTTDRRDVADRHRTMRSAIDWSYRLLEREEQRLLCRLGVFREPPTIEEVEQVCAADLDLDAATGLRTLLAKSLLRRRNDDGRATFSMPVPIQGFLLDQLERDGDAVPTRSRHAELQHRFVAEIEEQRWGARSDSWCQDVSTRITDIEAAIAYDFTEGDPDRAASTVANLYARRLRVGGLASAARWTEMAFERSASLSALDLGRLHLGAGYLHFLDGRTADARRHFELAGEQFDSVGHDRYRALAMVDVAGTWMGDPSEVDRSLAMCRDGLAMARRVGEAPLVAHALNVLGEVLRLHGDREAARAAYDEALALAHISGDEGHQLVLELNLAALALGDDEPDRALDLCRRALRAAIALNASALAASALSMVAGPTAALGAPELGARLLGAADAAVERLGWARGPGDTPEYHRTRAVLVDYLGAASAAELIARGRRLSLDDAIGLALTDW